MFHKIDFSIMEKRKMIIYFPLTTLISLMQVT